MEDDYVILKCTQRDEHWQILAYKAVAVYYIRSLSSLATRQRPYLTTRE